MGDIKQTNFRIDQKSADAFRRFCEDNGMNQAQGFDHIMQVVELDRAKAITPGRIVEIENFEKSIKDIMAAYLTSIEINNNTEERIKEQFSSSIEQKEQTICELHEKINRLQIDNDEMKKTMFEAKEREKNANEQMESAKRSAADQERINSMLTLQLADVTKKLEGYDNLIEFNATLQEKISDLDEQIKAAENNVKQIQLQNEIELERAVMAKEREMQNYIRQVDKENAKLIAQIELLKNN